jgi:DNA-binding NarL/FixJ family response regulator
MFDGIDIIKRIHDRGALIKVLDKPHLDLTTPLGRGFIAFLSAMAEDERHRILKRASEGRTAAKGQRYAVWPQAEAHRSSTGRSPQAAGESCRSIAKTMWPCTTLRSRGWRARPVLARARAYDTAVLDYYMPLLNGIEAARQIRARLPKTEVLIFTIHDDEKLIVDLLRAGARGYVSKAAAKQDLLDAIETVGAHRSFFGSNVTEILLKAYLAQPIRNEMPLSDQETRVVKLVGEGHTNNQIAKILNITVRTVETHRAAAMRKLNVSSSTGLVRHAVRIGLVEP